MAFTTWSALKTTILNDLADGSARTRRYSVGERQVEFHSLKEIMDFLAYCDVMILGESGVRTNLVTFKVPD